MAGDPHWTSVAWLSGFEGDTVGASAATDEGPDALAITFSSASVKIDNAQAKYGTKSLHITGTGQYISVPNSTKLSVANSDDKTFEAWIYLPSVTTRQQTIFDKRPTAGAAEFTMWVDTTGKVEFFTFISGVADIDILSTHALTANTWHHVAVTRQNVSGTRTWRLFLDGVLEGSQNETGAPSVSTNPVRFGFTSYSGGSTRYMTGWADEIRISHDFCRYTSTFTPAGPFPRGPSTDVIVTPDNGALDLEGHAPSLSFPFKVLPGAGELQIEGHEPLIGEILSVQAEAGAIVLEGKAASLDYLAAITPDTGRIEISGQKAFVQEHLVSELLTLALGEVVPAVDISLAATLALGEVTPPTQVSQAAVLALGEVIPPFEISQLVVLALVDVRPCTSTKLQAWRITRRDGIIQRFTSLDVDYDWGGEVYKACKSLNPSAADESSSLGDVGSIELAGLISDESITEKDLYGGLYDDAYVEVWLLDFDGVELPRLLASGWAGNLQHSDTQFSMEVLGAGSRLNQTPITQNYGPGCRWLFGSDNSTKPGCGFDREAKKVSGTIVRAKSRTVFTIDIGGLGPESNRQWIDGEIRFTNGENDGLLCEIKDLEFGSPATITLWSAAGFIPSVGDTFDLLPGCRRDKDTCKNVYDNYDNFGGYPDVPGKDAMNQTPDAKE